MTVLGIDPGLGNVGWAVITDKGPESEEYVLVASGVIKTGVKEKSEERLEKIYDEVRGLVEKYGVEVIGMESLFFAKNAKSAIKVAEAMGAIKVSAKKMGVEIREFTPLQIKMGLVGYGRAEKFQVEAMVREFLRTDRQIVSEHASDAAAAGLMCIFDRKIG